MSLFLRMLILSSVLVTLLLAFSGCENIEFPSYSGVYKLKQVSKGHAANDEDFQFFPEFPENIVVLQHPFNRRNAHNHYKFTIASPSEKKPGLLITETDGDLNPNNSISIILSSNQWEDGQSAYIVDHGHVCKWTNEAKVTVSFSPPYSNIDEIYPISDEYIELYGERYPVSKPWTTVPVYNDRWNPDNITLTITLSIRQYLDSPFSDMCTNRSYTYNASVSGKYKVSTPFDIGDPRIQDSPVIMKEINTVKQEVGNKVILHEIMDIDKINYNLTRRINDSL